MKEIDKYIPFRRMLRESLKDPEFKKAYDALGPEYRLISALIRKRLDKGWTQSQLAKKVGTKQPVISRLEGGNYNPTIKFLTRVTDALDAKLKVTIT
jgi:ribosome-binding protein aMBF1 (putative translation factor)